MPVELEDYKNDYVVYIHRNRMNKIPFYVGMGNKNRPYCFKSRGKIWHNYKNKYGNPIVEIYKTNLNIHEAFYLEAFLIRSFGRKRIEDNGILVNKRISDLGFSGFKHSEESKKKISNHFKGINGANTGRKHTKETRRNMSLAHKGKPQSEASKIGLKKYFLSVKGTKFRVTSEETKQKLREANIGKKLSEETKAKIRLKCKKLQSVAKKVIDNKTGIVYDSVTKAAESRGITMKQLSKWLTGVIKKREKEFSYYESSN